MYMQTCKTTTADMYMLHVDVHVHTTCGRACTCYMYMLHVYMYMLHVDIYMLHVDMYMDVYMLHVN